MTAQGQTKISTQYDLVFEGEDRQHVALIVLCKKGSLANLIEKEIGVTFPAQIKNNQYREEPIKTVSVYGRPGSEEKLKQIFDILTSFYNDKTHFSKELLQDIIDQLNTKGVYSRHFSKAAANQNKKQGNSIFQAKTAAQADLYDAIDKNDITFAVGPAGTGKTHVAMARAVEALKAGQVKKILLARPAQEAGEKIGYLPGDQNEKIAPYMRPLYDELDRAYGAGSYKRMIDQGIIELCPVGFMRGRTFNDAFIILDEAQNCTRTQIKMAMTRFGEGSRMVVTGDPAQSDLPRGVSGLKPAFDRLKGKEGIGYVEFSSQDVVRHKVVQTVVDALGDDFDAEPAPRPAPVTSRVPQA